MSMLTLTAMWFDAVVVYVCMCVWVCAAASPHVAPAAAEPLATAADAAHVAHHPTHGAGGAAPTATDDSSDEDSSAQMFKDASELLAYVDRS